MTELRCESVRSLPFIIFLIGAMAIIAISLSLFRIRLLNIEGEHGRIPRAIAHEPSSESLDSGDEALAEMALYLRSVVSSGFRDPALNKSPDNHLFLRSRHEIAVLDASGEYINWRFHFGPAFILDITNEDLIVAEGRRIYKFQGRSGEIVWLKDLPFRMSSFLVDQFGIDSRVITYRNVDSVHAIDRDTGESIWQRSSADPHGISPFLDSGSVILIDNNSLVAISALSGHVRWRIPWRTDRPTRFATLRNGEVVCSNASGLWRIEVSDGKIRQLRTTPSGTVVASRSQESLETVLLTDRSGRTVVVSATNGCTVFPLAYGMQFIGRADELFILSPASNADSVAPDYLTLKAIDPSSGKEKWRWTSDRRLWASIAIGEAHIAVFSHAESFGLERSETGMYRKENGHDGDRSQADFARRMNFDEVTILDTSTGHRIAASPVPAGIVSVVSHGNAIFASQCNGDVVEVVLRPHQATGAEAVIDDAESIESVNSGTLIVRTGKLGARVFVDGVKHPDSKEAQSTVSAGFHTVSVSLPAHQTYAETVIVESGGTVAVSANLAPLIRLERVQYRQSVTAISGRGRKYRRFTAHGLELELSETGDLVAMKSATGNILWRVNAKVGSWIVDINHLGIMVFNDFDSELSIYSIEKGLVVGVETGVYSVAAANGIVAYCREWSTAGGSMGMLRIFEFDNESRTKRVSVPLNVPLHELRGNTQELQLESRRGTVYINFGNELFAVGIASGTKKWVLENSGDGLSLGLHLMGEILFCVNERKITAVDWHSGVVLWETDAARSLRSWLPNDDGLILFGDSADYQLSVRPSE